MAGTLEDSATYCDSGSEDNDSLNVEDEEGWEDVEQEIDEQQPIVSLFSGETFRDVLTMLEHCKQNHDFDFLRVRQELGVYVSTSLQR
jgi:protein arginine N-methyltransferase 3